MPKHCKWAIACVPENCVERNDQSQILGNQSQHRASTIFCKKKFSSSYLSGKRELNSFCFGEKYGQVISALEENNSTTILGLGKLPWAYNFLKQANSMTNDAENNCQITTTILLHIPRQNTKTSNFLYYWKWCCNSDIQKMESSLMDTNAIV